MDFEVNINGKTEKFELFHDVLNYIGKSIAVDLAQWNNFHEGQPITILVQKIPGRAPILNIAVDDTAKAGDAFGGLPPWITEEEYLLMQQGQLTQDQMNTIMEKKNAQAPQD